MSKKKELLNNSMAFVVSQVLMITFRFVSRPIMIKYIGEELIGVGGAISSLLTTMSLAELGFHATIIYHLYKPLAEENYSLCNEYIMVLKRCYQVIAVFILSATLLLCPFLHVFIKGITITPYIYLIFFVSGLTSALGYLFADKVQLLYADKKDFISKKIEIIFGFSMKVIGLIIVVITGNYLLYMLIESVRSIFSNILIMRISQKYYPWLKKCPINKKILREVFQDVKNLCILNFAGYVYFNTDNLVISSFLGVVSVTYFGNYMGITSALRTFADAGMKQIQPFLGQMYVEDKSVEKNLPIIMLNTFLRFLISGALIIPTYILINNFIAWWVGDRYILSNEFIILLCLDFYLFLVHRCLSDYISISGSYAYERNVSAMGAAINLGLSIVLVKYIGIEGVLTGTVISECFYWIARGYIVFRKIFVLQARQIFIYIFKNILYFATVVGTIYIGQLFAKSFSIQNFIMDFIFKGLVIECLFCVIVLVFYLRTKEFKMIIKMIKK